MIKNFNVLSSSENVNNLEFDKYVVFVRDNMKKVIIDETEFWEYDEVVYSYQEWDSIQAKKISILEAENKALKQELSITQDAVNELIFNSLNM